MPVATRDPNDVLWLRAAVGGARVVMLGESARTPQAIRYLRDELGFEVLAGETSLWGCETKIANECVTSSLPIVTGFDYRMSPAARASLRDALLPLLPSADRDRARVVFDRLPNDPAKGRDPRDQRTYEEISADEDVLTKARDTLRKGTSTPERDLIEYGLENVLVLYSLTAYEPERFRDEQLANNLMWLALVRYPDRRIAIWPATTHGGTNSELSIRTSISFANVPNDGVGR